MKTNLVAVCEEQTWYDPGLKPNVLNIIQAAQSCGKISTADIAEFLPHDLTRDRERLARLLAGLIGFFRENEITLVPKRVTPVRRAFVVPTPVSKQVEPAPAEIAPDALTRKRGYSQQSELNVDLSTEDPEPESDGDVLARYFRDIRPYTRILTHEEVRELCRKIHEEQDLDARNTLVLHNQRLLLKIARRYLGRGLEYADLVQEGQFWLIKTAERFDPDKGMFSTYAHWWVKQAITRAIADYGSLVRSPVHAHELYNKVQKIAEQAGWKLGRPPSEEEIAEIGGLPLSTVQKALHHLKIPVVSLETVVGEEDTTLGELIADECAVAPDEALMLAEDLEGHRDGLEEFLTALSNLCRYRKRDFAMFFLRYGLDNEFQGRTLEEVGKAFKITYQAVWSVCNNIWKALGKEGHWSEADLLLEIACLRSSENKVGSEAAPAVPFNGIDFSGVDLSVLVNEQPFPGQKVSSVSAGANSVNRGSKQAVEPLSDSLSDVFQRVLSLVAKVYEVTQEALCTQTRGKAQTAWARQVVMYLLRSKYEWSYPTIGSVLGGRNHSTVMHGCKLVAEVMVVDAKVRDEIEQMFAVL